MNLNFAKLTCSFLTALALASGCDSDADADRCVETVTVLESIDSPTPAGPTAAEIFALVEGTRETELEYVGQGGGAVFVDIEPGGEGTTALTLELARERDAEVRWIDAEVEPAKGPIVLDIAVYCPDRLEIDAKLGFATADEVFAELFDVVVAAEVYDGSGELETARINKPFDPADLQGALEVVGIEPANPDRVDWWFDIAYPLTESAADEGGEVGQPRGAVGGGAQYTSGKGRDATVSYGVFYVGKFGGFDIY